MTAVVLLSKPCGECGGTGRGIIPDPTGVRTSGVLFVDCPSCVGGWLPDDGMVSAITHGEYGNERDRKLAISILVAAARHQFEKGADDA